MRALLIAGMLVLPSVALAGPLPPPPPTRVSLGAAASGANTDITSLASPALTGTPTAPTPAAGDNTTKIQTAAGTVTAVANEATARNSAITAATAPILFNNQIGSSCDTATVGHQACTFRLYLQTSSTTANQRLTADGNAASATNSICIPAASSAVIDNFDFVGTDQTSGAQVSYAAGWTGIYGRAGAASTTTLTYKAGASSSSLAPTIAADTTNGCASIVITPPNTDPISWTANVRLVIAQ